MQFVLSGLDISYYYLRMNTVENEHSFVIVFERMQFVLSGLDISYYCLRMNTVENEHRKRIRLKRDKSEQKRTKPDKKGSRPSCVLCVFRSCIENGIHPTLLYNNDEEMGLPDIVKSADPFKVKVKEWTLADKDVPLNTETEDRVISPSAQTISLVDHTIHDELNVNSGKRKKRVAFVSWSPPVKKERAKGPLLLRQRMLLLLLLLLLTPERVLEDASPDNVRTRPPSSRFVILSFGSADTDIPALHVVSPMTLAPTSVNAPVAESVSDGRRSSGSGPEAGALSATPSQGSSTDDFYESQTIDSAFALNVYVPNWNVTNNARIDNPAICQNLLDHVTPPGYRAALHNQHDTAFLNAVNINSAQHATVAIKVGELANFHTENVGLVKRVSALKSERDGLKNQVVGEGKMMEEFVS
nr:transposase (putative), gypsy type [Tanacetum cinerariifolium]